MKTCFILSAILCLLFMPLRAQHSITPLPEGILAQKINTAEGYQQFLSLPVPQGIEQYFLQNFINENILHNTAGFSPFLTNEKQSPLGTSYTYNIQYNGIDIFPAQVKLFVDNNGILRSVYHNILQLSIPTGPYPFSTDFISRKAEELFSNKKIMNTGRAWTDDGNTLLPCFSVKTRDTLKGDVYEWYIDGAGAVLFANPLFSHKQATDTPAKAFVYNPDPLTTAQVPYGGPYVNNSHRDTAVLTAQRQLKTLRAKVDGDSLILENEDFYINDLFSYPYWPVTRVKLGDTFNFTRSQYQFCNVNAFYHLSTYKAYVNSIGYSSLPGFRIMVDAHAFNGNDESRFTPGDNPPSLQYGDGGVPDAEDADVVVHEFGHGLSQGAAPSTNLGTQRKAIDEGIGDYLAASYSKSLSSYNWQHVFNWDGNNGSWKGRTVAIDTINYSNLTNNMWTDGQVFATALARANEWCGREVTDKLLLEGMHSLAINMNMPQIANAILQADTLKNSGANAFCIACAFASIGILPPVQGCTFSVNSEAKMEQPFKVYNSAGFADGEMLTVAFATAQKYTACLYDATGRQVNTFGVEGSVVSLNGQPYTQGIYFLVISDEMQRTYSIKLQRH